MSSSATNIIIIPFRINKGKMEVLLKSYVQKPKPFISLISGPTFAFDPSPIFSAARIFLTDFLAMSYQLDEKVMKFYQYILKFDKEYKLGFS